MSSNLEFLSPVQNQTSDLFANATGATQFSKYSHTPSTINVGTSADTLVKNGLSSAFASGNAVFTKDPLLSELFTQTQGSGQQGAFEVIANSQAKVIGNFSVNSCQNFSFNFATNLEVKSKEIENSNVEYAQGKSSSTFLVLDTSNPNAPQLLDYFVLQGELISSQKYGAINYGASGNVKFNNPSQSRDVDGNNCVDFVKGSTTGQYSRWFGNNANITVVEVNTSTIQLLGDTNINNLGRDVKYGTINNDRLDGTYYNDSVYGSLGNDTINGYEGHDVLEGGLGNDRIAGGDGNDRIAGGDGNDFLDGGFGFDTIHGGSGTDTTTYDFYSGPIVANLVNGVVSFPGNSTYTDTLVSIENLVGSRGNDTIIGDTQNNSLNGSSGNDYIYAGTNNDTLLGGTGNDNLYGEGGNDILNGTNGSFSGGYEVDRLVGGSGNDLFVLGNSNGNYYNDNYDCDYAVIQDFNLAEDKIQLQGSSGKYWLGNWGGNSHLYENTNCGWDKVAVLENVQLDNNALHNAAFQYV